MPFAVLAKESLDKESSDEENVSDAEESLDASESQDESSEGRSDLDSSQLSVGALERALLVAVALKASRKNASRDDSETDAEQSSTTILTSASAFAAQAGTSKYFPLFDTSKNLDSSQDIFQTFCE